MAEYQLGTRVVIERHPLKRNNGTFEITMEFSPQLGKNNYYHLTQVGKKGQLLKVNFANGDQNLVAMKTSGLDRYARIVSPGTPSIKPVYADEIQVNIEPRHEYVNGIGNCLVIAAGAIKPGMTRLYNYGNTAIITNIKIINPGWVEVTVKCNNGEEYARKHRATTMIPIAQGVA